MSMTTAFLPRGRHRALVLFVLVALFLSSCGTELGATIEASTPHDVVVVGKPAARVDDRQSRTEQRPDRVRSRDDLVGETRVVPDDVHVDSADPTQLVVRFTAGGAPCTGVRLSVDPGPATVGIALFVGTPPEHADTVCDAEAKVQEVHGTLERPVGSRDLIWLID